MQDASHRPLEFSQRNSKRLSNFSGASSPQNSQQNYYKKNSIYQGINNEQIQSSPNGGSTSSRRQSMFFSIAAQQNSKRISQMNNSQQTKTNDSSTKMNSYLNSTVSRNSKPESKLKMLLDLNDSTPKSKESIQSQQLKKIVMNKLLPSQIILVQHKNLQQRKKSSFLEPDKEVSGRFRVPTIATVEGFQNNRYKSNSGNQQNLAVQKQQQSQIQQQQNIMTNSSNNNTSLKKQDELISASSPQSTSREKIQQDSGLNNSQIPSTGDNQGNNLSSAIKTPIRDSFLAKKLKVDLHKVCLGVRLAKVFLPAYSTPLTLGGPRMNALFIQQNELFQKSMPKLDLMTLQNSPHFFDENIFKYFHAINLGEGRVFGDLGILTKKPRAATIVCQEDCYFGVLNVEDYSKILMDQKKKKMQKSLQFLASTINVSLSIEKMSKISQFFEKRFFAAGERIYEEGDPVHFIFLIKKGEVELFRKMSTSYGISSSQCMQVSVGIIGEKSFFGEDDALFQRSRKFSATARIDTNLLVAKKKDFLKMMSEIPEMYSELKQMATQKEKWRDEKYSDMFYTRAQIKTIESLHKKSKRKHFKRSRAAFSQSADILHMIENAETAQSNKKSEESVKNQLLSMEMQQEIKATALKHMIEHSIDAGVYNSPKSNHHHNANNQSMNSSNISNSNTQKCYYYNQMVQKSPPSSPFNKSSDNNKSCDFPLQLSSPDQSFSQKVQDQNKHNNSTFLPSTTGSNNSQKISFKKGEDYFSKLSPRLQTILQEYPNLVKETTMKELKENLKHKKRILNRNLSGKELSAIDVYKETRDVCTGSNDIYKKLEKVAERRKELQKSDSYHGYHKQSRDYYNSGKNSMIYVESLLKRFKDKEQAQQQGATAEGAIAQSHTMNTNNPIDKVENSRNDKDKKIPFSKQLLQQRTQSLNSLFPASAGPSKALIYFGMSKQLNSVQQQQQQQLLFSSSSQYFQVSKSNKLANQSAFEISNSSFMTPQLSNSKGSIYDTTFPSRSPISSSSTSSSTFQTPSVFQPFPSVKQRNNKMVIVNHMGKPLTFTSVSHSS